ncbi:MAG: terpene cyclase/mutase family protein [Planctomycetaceae bacterium]|jgi:squalene-hopene/tetraprenyl-beta-curcumene cyclase|nr:terpene cyclase/mutase family protein [Planctomycetaceae bacterium]
MKHTFTILFFLLSAVAAFGQDAAKIRQAMDKGAEFLRSSQKETGAWSATPRSGIGPTTIILAGLIDAGVKADDPMIKKGLTFLEASTREDGGVYTPDGFFQNYETCCAVMCFAKANAAIKKANGSEPYKELLARAEKFLRKQQYTEDRDSKKEDPNYGGVGYGGTTRPDLSNTQFFLDALKATGKDANDPAIQKALVFVSRCQNMESEHNTLPFVKENAANLDGGFIYVNQPGESRMETKAESLRSYGAMTYAGLKSMLYAGLTKEDKRVKAAFTWIAGHYTVTENPGRGTNGLFYYYQTMAKALGVLQLLEITDTEGKKHNWRSDISAHLLQKQREDGSWINEGSRQYMENDPNLVTGYALLVLSEVRQ